MQFDLDTYPSVKLLAQQLEKVSGKPALIVMDSSLGDMLSTQITARTPGQPAHVVKVNSKYHALRHALASVQLRFILRRYQIQSPLKDVGLAPGAVDIISEQLKNVEQIPAGQLPDIAHSIAGNLIVQLRSALPTVAVHHELQKYQSELCDQQQEAIKITINNNLQSLKETIFPAQLVRWNRLLAATESFGLASLIKNKPLMVPFESLGLLEPAKEIAGPLLLGEYDGLDDLELVEITASKIKMTELHQWI
ncbi:MULTISPECIES: hypothetical protein [unclassified Endozoicomonas]|uniref:hypothetical protein n=1 Tax=unclassified Endozoicomonas TaxID=2644528 RepID=UPI003BB6CB68